MTHHLLERRPFSELGARARAHALLDPGSGRELCGPWARVESPWLEPQGLVPQADDGAVVVRGTVDRGPCVVLAVEGRFMGGGIGEVSGAKLAMALELAAADARAGRPTAALLLLETGGVRLQEATLGLNAVAEVCAALLELREHAPVVGVVAGPLGCFGGMAIAAGLCSHLLLTHGARLGLNGPEVIEAEAGAQELDASDRELVWALTGGRARYAAGLADALVDDDVDALRRAASMALGAPVPEHRSGRLAQLRARLDALAPEDVGPGTLARRWGRELAEPDALGLAPAPDPLVAARAAAR